jgi:DNA-binding MarR family transcriptional regulator
MRNFWLYARQHGLSMTQIATLFMVRHKGPSSISEIGDELQITNPAASQLVDRLVQQGLLLRTEDPNDRRLKQIALSKQGEMTLQEGLRARQRWLGDLVKQLSPEEQEQAMATLNLLIAKAEQLEMDYKNKPCDDYSNT